MLVVYIILFVLSVIFSAFFSSAETSLLSLNKIKLNVRAKKREKKALVLAEILKEPEEFFSTILIGNNFVNIAAASVSTVIFSHVITANEELSLLFSTLATTVIILLFSEVIPKSYAFRYNERLANLYAYPIRFFKWLLTPLVKPTTWISNSLFSRSNDPEMEKEELTIEEIKHFLSSQETLVRYHPGSIRMVNEIIDIAQKDIKSIMTPRLNLVAMEEKGGIEELKSIILEKEISKVPVYREHPDNIIGILHSRDLLSHLWENDLSEVDIMSLLRPPIFISEYSSLNYVLRQFKRNRFNMAIIIDEYGATIGAITLNDIFSEILGEIEMGMKPMQQLKKNLFRLNGNIPVDEVNHQLHLNLPEKVDYTTMSGLFIYHYGKYPKEKSKLRFEHALLVVKRMGERKIDELLLIKDDHRKTKKR